MRYAFMLLWLVCVLVSPHVEAAEPPPQIEIIETTPLALPRGILSNGQLASVDCNSPVEWDSQGRLFVFTSHTQPFRSSGNDLTQLDALAQTIYVAPHAEVRGGLWIEATYRADDGKLYGWYHNEPPSTCGSGSRLTAPRIGALVSTDDGLTWQNLGVILEAPADALNCSTRNFYFAGGNGDFSVLLDQSGEYFYFFISTYHRQFGEQGVAVARMAFADRDDPVGKVWKWYNGAFNQPGRGGRVGPTFPALVDWHRDNANAYWGAAVHYNTYLNRYVMLLNHAVDRNWRQEGIYIAYNDNLADPLGWSAPERLPLNGLTNFYPEAIGPNFGETDKLMGQRARLFLGGNSNWELFFYRTDNPDPMLLQKPSRRASDQPSSLPTRGNQ